MKSILTRFRKSFGFYKQFTAFTLAEVLITLGIIGIVAALTIPTLMNNVQKHTFVVALKKFYSTQSNGWAQLLADEGVQNLEDTSVFQSMGQSDCTLSQVNDVACKPFFDNLKKYFKFEVVIAPSYKGYELQGGVVYSDFTNRNVLVFPDGSIMADEAFYKKKYQRATPTQVQIAAAGGHMYSEQTYNITIDVNGFKKPNTYGRDIFSFDLSGDGKLYPAYGKDHSFFGYGELNVSGYWQKSTYGYPCGIPGSTNIKDNWGYGCAARVMEEGWQMNY